MKKNILDNIEKYPQSVDEISKETICRDTGIDEAKIYDGVFKKIGMEKTAPKKRIGKRILIGAAAAVAAVSVIGSTVIAVGGSVFGDIFKGNTNAEEVYRGEDVKIENLSDNLNVELTGITGDENSVYVSIELTNKDGSSFTHSDDSKIGLYTNTDFLKQATTTYDSNSKMMTNMRYVPVADSFIIDVDQSEWQKTDIEKYCYGISGWGMWDYLDKDVETDDRSDVKCVKTVVSDDGKKLNLYIKYIRMNTPEGSTMKVSCKGLSEYYKVKLLKTYNNDYDGNIFQDYSENYYANGIEGELIEKGDGTKEFWQTENKKLDIRFDISLKLDYKAEVKSVNISANDAKSLFYKADNTNDDTVPSDVELKISPFGINISAETILTDEINIDTFGSETKVVMQDGTEYGLMSVIELDDNGQSFINAEYCTKEDVKKFPDSIDNTLLMLDTDNIKSITLNGTEVYHKS